MLPLVQHDLCGQDHRCYATQRHDDRYDNKELQTKEESLESLLGSWRE